MFFVVINSHKEADNKNDERDNSDNGAQKTVAVHKGCGKTEKNKTCADKSASESFFCAPFIILVDSLFCLSFIFAS